MEYWDMLDECADVARNRGESYGDIKENFKKTTEVLATNYGLNLKPYQIAEVLIATKIARDLHKVKADNTTDLINYIAIRKHLIATQYDKKDT